MKIVKGYIYSNSFCGSEIPQNVQNLFIRDFCEKNNLKYLLSSVEFSISESTYSLYGALDELHNIHGLVFYSLYQLPYNNIERKKIYKKLFEKKNKIFYFALENLKLEKKKDIENIEILWQLKKIILKQNVDYTNIKKYGNRKILYSK